MRAKGIYLGFPWQHTARPSRADVFPVFRLKTFQGPPPKATRLNKACLLKKGGWEVFFVSTYFVVNVRIQKRKENT